MTHTSQNEDRSGACEDLDGTVAPGDISVATRPVTLRDVIKDCGGATHVAKKLEVSVPSVYEWIGKGHLPYSDLRLEGATTYSDQLSQLQQKGRLSAAAIRRLGRRL
ncbi:hypothetical protein ACGLWX_18200 [Halomonas sp. HMF6819]|uniref:hypothetical protein n=1 Tax=Halomonas sp. HMF6819 TaxID=3373085 RepID=UPI0037A50BD2